MSVNISLFAGAGAQFFDNNGVPLTGGLLYTYSAGTTTPSATYTSITGSIANSNPIVLDSAGRVSNEIWLTGGNTYKFILQTSTGVQIGSWDNISGANDQTALASSIGSSLVGYNEGGTGAVTTTVQDKLRQTVSVKDFGAVGDGTTDDTTAIQNAINACKVGGITGLSFPSGKYLVSSTINFQGFFGDGGLSVVGQSATLKASSSLTGTVINIDDQGGSNNDRMNLRINNLNIIGNTTSSGSAYGIQINALTSGVTADVFISNCVISYCSTGIVNSGGIILDFNNVTFKYNGLGFSSPNDSNSLSFYGCRFFQNTSAVYINGFALGIVIFVGCEIEDNSYTGTNTDGIYCCKFTNAGQLNFVSCHFEGNNCQYNIYFQGSGSSNGSAISMIGCESICTGGYQVYVVGSYLSATNCYLNASGSAYQTYLDSASSAVLINTSTTISGSSTKVTSFGTTNLGTSLNFGSSSASLSDYQEGTFTGSTITGINCSSISISNASYVKIGKLVTLQATFTATLTATSTATYIIFTIPFNTNANASAAVGSVAHTATTNGLGFVSDTTPSSSNSAELTIPANQVTVANGTSFTANFTYSYYSA